ncbi:MAG: hypothetical protein J6U54_22720 [Clostridiales bacterium]|nr:hypothetical protein [Clostridiales bacterium]
MMDPRELEKGKSFLWSMAGLIALIEFCSKNAGVTKDLGKGFIRLSVAMGLMLGIAKLASMMKVKDLAKGIVATAALSVLVMGMAKAAKDCKGADGMVKAMAGMLFGISSILLLVTLLSFVNPKKMGIALGATLLVIEAIAHLASALTKNIQVTGENNKFSYGGLIVGLITVMALGALLAYLTSIPIQNVGAAAGAVIGVTLAVAAVGKALSKIHGQVDMNTVKSAVTALAFVAIISGVLFVFTKAIEQYHLNTNEMLKAAGAIAIVLVGITPALWAMSQFDSNAGNFEAMGKSIAAVILGMIAAAASIAVLSRCGGDSSKMIAAATAIAITLLALCAPIAVIGAVGEFAKNANPATMRATIIGAIGALVGVSAALFVLSKWGNVDNMAKAASAISIVLLAICVPIAVLGAVGQFAATAKPEVMVAAIAGAIIALIGVCWALQNFAANIDMEGVNEINAAMPSILAGVMAISILTVAIAAAGLLAGPATAGIGVVIAALGALAVLLVAMAGLGALLQNIDGLRDILITGLDFLVLVAGKLGEVIGSFVGGMAEGLTSHLEKIATDLENFSKHMVPFSENMSKVNSDAFDAVGSLVEAILLLTGASIIEGLTSWLGFGSGLDGLDFTTLGNAVVDFCTSISSIPGDAMSKANIAATVANKLAEMSSNIQAQGGLAGLIFGDKDLGNFGKDIAMFGAAIVGFIAAVKEGIPENAVDLAQRACDASIPMINLTKSLVSQGGFIKRFITGEKNLSDFSTQITNFASGLVTFIATLSAIEEISPDYSDMIKRCSDAVVPLVDLANGIKASGGVLQDFIGESTLDVFGSTLTPFAKYLKAFVIQLGLLYKTTPNANELIDKSVAGTQSLVDLSNKLPNIGGIKTIFTGKDDLDSFGKNLKGFGESLASYAGTITDVDMQTITDSATVLGSFISYAQAVKDVKSDAFKGLNDGLKNLSKMPISKISKEITDNTQTAIDAYDTLFTDLKDNVTTHETDDADTYKSYGKAVDAGIRDGILIDRYTEVCTNGLGKLVKSITDYLDLSMKSTKFETYGKNLVLGLQKGITDNQALAVDAAKGMATSTGAVVPKALKEHSPSRLTYGFGKFFSQGFANGINDYAGEAVNAATGMSDEIVNTANTIISSLARVIDSDIDMQPTIRPVLDTSNIEKGAGKLNRIFRNSDLSLAYVASGQIKEANNAKYAGQVSNNTTTSGEPSQISFVQNNYSPKALSRMEIYRQTKNQISMMKGVVANA